MLSKNEPKNYQKKPSPYRISHDKISSHSISHDKISPHRISHNKIKKEYETLRSTCKDDQIVVMELILNDGRNIPVKDIKIDPHTVIAHGINSNEVIITGFAACQFVLSVQKKPGSNYPERVRIIF